MNTNDLKKSYSDAVESLFREKAELQAFAQSKQGARLASSFDKTLCWCVGLSQVFADNPAQIHLAGVRSEVVNILALSPLHFYRQSVICLRIILDEVLAFSYFESHPREFATLLRDPDFYVSKKAIFEFHKAHSWRNIVPQEIDVRSQIELQYRDLSRIIHAQTPKCISLTTSFDSFAYSESETDSVVQMAEKNDEAVAIFLSSVYRDAFNEFTKEFKRSIIKSWSGQLTKALGLTP
jgi:hypothetical protein